MKEIFNFIVLWFIALKQCVYPTPIEKLGCLNFQFPYAYNGHCYATCPEGTYTFADIKACFDECPSNSVPVGKECKCQKGYILSMRACLACAKINAPWDEETEKCGETCPYPLSIDVEQNKCVCKDRYTINENDECVLKNCAKGEFRAYGLCYSCSSKQVFSSVDAEECIKCSNREYVDGECRIKEN